MSEISFPAYTIRRNCPQHWQEDKTGLMRRAIDYYVRQRFNGGRSSDERYHQEQVEIVRKYFEHYITAPVWDIFEDADELSRLRRSIKNVDSIEQLIEWHTEAIAIGFDPF